MKSRLQPATALVTSHVLALTVLQYLLAVLTSAAISRALGPTGRGMYYLPILAASTAVAFGKLGIDQANVFLSSTAGVAAGRLAAQNRLVAVSAGALLVSAVLAMPELLPAVFGETPRRFLLVAALTIPLGIHTQLAGSLLAVCGQVRRQYVASTIAALLQALCAAALYASGRLSIEAALWIAVAGAAANWVVVALHDSAVRSSIAVDLALLRKSLASALVLHAGMVLFFLHLRIDMYWVNAWLGPQALGQYSVSVTIAETVMFATDAVAAAVLPTQMAGTIQEAAGRALRAARINGIVGAAIALTLALAALPLVTWLFGDAFGPAVLPLVVLLPGIVALGMQRVCGAPALRAGRPSRILAIYAAALSVNVLLNAFWIPSLGIVGASLASTVSYTVGSVLFLTWTARLAHVPLAGAIRVRAADLDAISNAARTGVASIRGLVMPPREIR